MPHHVFFPLHPDWQECITAFFAHVYSLSNSTYTSANYRTHLQHFFTDCRKAPDDYTRADVEHYLASSTHARWRHDTPPSASLRHARLVALSSFYRFAGNWIVMRDGTRQRLLQIPPPTVGIAYGKRGNHHNAFSPDELKRFFAAIDTSTVTGLRDKALFLLLFWSARRRSEIARLTWGAIEQYTVLDSHGRSRAIALYHFRNKGKGILEDDSAELPQPALSAILRYLDVSGRMATITPADPLFVNYRGNPLSVNGIRYLLANYVAKAGITTRVSIHSFRHTRARAAYLVSNHDVLAVMKLLRHTNLATTQVYLEELAGTMDTTAELLLAHYGSL